MFNLKGKTAIVTGAGRGLGEQISKGLAEMGAFVFCGGRNVEPLLKLCASINEVGGASTPDNSSALLEGPLTEGRQVIVGVVNSQNKSGYFGIRLGF